jgi:hypothetical protein
MVAGQVQWYTIVKLSTNFQNGIIRYLTFHFSPFTLLPVRHSFAHLRAWGCLINPALRRFFWKRSYGGGSKLSILSQESADAQASPKRAFSTALS